MQEVDLPARKRKEHQCVCLPDLEAAVRAYVSVLADLTMYSSSQVIIFRVCFLTVPFLTVPNLRY